jgi:Fe-S cluster biosynthesis and repair protein YggX
MTESFQCERCDRTDVARLERSPIPTELGARIQASICHDCWEEWKTRQMTLINHYGLKLQEAEAREFLYANMRSFLFGEGEAADVDTSREGSVQW